MKPVLCSLFALLLVCCLAAPADAQCNVQSNAAASSSAAIQQQALLSALLSQQNRPAASAQSFAGSIPQSNQNLGLNAALLSLFAQAQPQALRIQPPAPVLIAPGANAQSFAGTNSNLDFGQLANLLAAQNTITAQNVALGGCSGGSCSRSRSVARSSVRSLVPLRRPTSISRSFSLQRT